MRIAVKLAFLAALVSLGIDVATAQEKGNNNPPPPRAGLTLTAAEFPDGGVIPVKFTRTAEKPVTPKLQWINVLPNTVSFTLIVHDPDTARNFTTEDVLHWMVFNIPADVRELPEGLPPTDQLPNGAIQGKNRNGTPGYAAMAAGTGPYHHYVFELFALDTKLAVGPDATRAEVLKAMDGHILEKGVMVGRFRREK
jgi:Raf kinase inhibitor-like YbhB/YbcL family protein